MSHSDSEFRPTINHLITWAEKEPELLQQWFEQEVENLISSAPITHQDKLRGLQFKIEMEKRRAKNPMASCIAISKLMYESFYELKHVLHDADSVKSNRDLNKTGKKAKVLPFRTKAVNNRTPL